MVDPPTGIALLAERLKVLAEPKRLQILNLLMAGVQCNCELGEHLQMAPNLISHHLRVLHNAGLVDVERDALDARWIYYSVNQDALAALNEAFALFFEPARIQPRRPSCGPRQSVLPLSKLAMNRSDIAGQKRTGSSET
jgi:ArsR family transcriptional regulator